MGALTLFDKIRGRNPLTFIHFESSTITPEGSLGLTAAWQGGDPIYEMGNGFRFARTDGSQWLKLQGSGFTTGDKTIETLMTISEYTTWSRIFDIGDSVDNYINVSQQDIDSFRSSARSTPSSERINRYTRTIYDRPKVDELCHIVAVHHATTGLVELYKNGVLCSVSAASQELKNEATANAVGALFWSVAGAVNGVAAESKWKGTCAYAAYYNEAFSQGDVTTHFNLLPPPRTYQETILDTEGLLSYWPLYVNGEDLSLSRDHMTVVGSVSHNTEALSPEGLGAYVPPYDPERRETVTNYMAVDNNLSTRCIEVWCRFKNELDLYKAAFAFNQFGEIENNADRVQFIQRDGNDYNLYALGASNLFNGSQTLFAEPRHVVMQYEEATDQSKLYVDGDVLLEVPGNLFSGLIAGLKLSVGAFTHTSDLGIGVYSNSEVSDCAIYNRPLTQHEIDARVNFVSQAPIVNLLLSLSSITWSNRETKAQANPQPIYLEHHGIAPFDSTYAVKNNPFYTDPIVDQNSKLREFGYIESKTELSDIPVANKRVMLFSHDSGVLIDETVSDENGNYRFDSLLMSKKYMVTAQYGNADEHTPPDYSAISSDWQTPTPYGRQ
ncbi:hypothetical protein CW745_13860 [Psychromonas sp. psych-6C06]|uniref:LamG-like jellyroll fold domain-containing protein n=1 Tax=Psychromonas sp. psych-6C06 TaxID=2058089 RepID=UPI000C34E067|nr:LamG-like jellyroll fold domain-containing protein [Psychromonas sp. psych-6C06]PKF60612.1 hypothetical protein CW745_13860 [Psychromonas sp. psych-6C06]